MKPLAPSELILSPWYSVHLNVEREPATGCLLWLGRTLKSGHGTFSFWGSSYLAHREAWAFVNGPIPKGRVIHHECRQPRCVEPEHLFALTHRQHNRLHRGLGEVHAVPVDAAIPAGAEVLP